MLSYYAHAQQKIIRNFISKKWKYLFMRSSAIWYSII